MGHIVNSISTRIGWFDTWKDEIHLDLRNQCDYIHYFIRIRFLLVFIFFAKEPWDEYLMIFSHFELLKKKRIFHVSIFVYLAKLIMFGTDLELYLIKFLKSRGRTKRNKHLRLIDIIKRVMIGCLLSFKSDYEFHDSVDYFYDEKNRKYAKIKRKNMEKFIDGYYFIAFNNYSIDAFRLMIKFYKLNRGFLRNKICLLRHLALRAQFERVTMKWGYFKDVIEATFLRYVYAPFFSWLCAYIEYLVGKIFMPHRIKVSYHHFSNDNVTPAFVSRYMLRKLDQNYLWANVLNPIIKDLKVSMLMRYGASVETWHPNALFNDKQFNYII